MGKISVGQRFGRLVVIKLHSKTKKYQKLWECKCDCGNPTIVRGDQLTSGHTKSCGCLQKERIKEANKNIHHKGSPLNLTGQKFGRLTAIKIIGKNKAKNNIWECKCECGNFVNVIAHNLVNGHTKSCGCLQKEKVSINIIKRNTTHGKSDSTLYKKWCGMKRRCYNPHDKRYPDYGGRGIKICDKWVNDFKAFYDWAIKNGYRDGLTIERENVNKSYTPENCKWIPMSEQANNKRNNRLITKNGETHTVSEWAVILGVNCKTLFARLYRHGTIFI